MSGMDKDVFFVKNNKKTLIHKNLNAVEKKAYNAYTNQLSKCNKPNHPDYKYYGAKGIKVRYSRVDFIKWYCENIKNFEGKKPSIGRKDHEKDYCFDNIQIESHSRNSIERHERLGTPIREQRMIGLFSKKNHECIAIFKGIKAVCDFVGAKDTGHIWRCCVNKNPRGSLSHSWYYRFVSDELGAISS